MPLDRDDCSDVPFCMPIIIKNKNKTRFKKALNICKKLGIEYRPIVSGFLGYQNCYKSYFKSDKDYPDSVYLHNYGFYIGLYHGIKEKDLLKLTSFLNEI
jgi:dTDP-4-amino-4,6-dideoxygalactose transaminase